MSFFFNKKVIINKSLKINTINTTMIVEESIHFVFTVSCFNLNFQNHAEDLLPCVFVFSRTNFILFLFKLSSYIDTD
jgi:hypothetical protein